MHGGAHGDDHVGHVLGDAGVLRLLQVGGDGGGGGAGAQGHEGGTGDVPEHGLDAVLAAADVGEDGEGFKYAAGSKIFFHNMYPLFLNYLQICFPWIIHLYINANCIAL